VVTAFSEDRGLGEVTLADGRVLRFHATALVDGTRSVAVGARVVVEVRPTHRGEHQADRVSRI